VPYWVLGSVVRETTKLLLKWKHRHACMHVKTLLICRVFSPLGNAKAVPQRFTWQRRLCHASFIAHTTNPSVVCFSWRAATKATKTRQHKQTTCHVFSSDTQQKKKEKRKKSQLLLPWQTTYELSCRSFKNFQID
jgi:hypothetical protein